MARVLSGLALWLVFLTNPNAVHAQGTTVLVVADGTPSEQELLRSNAEAALREAEIGISTQELSEAAAFPEQECKTCIAKGGECADLLARAPASWVLHLTIRKQPENASIAAKLFSADNGQLLQVGQRVCRRCQSAERMARQTLELVGEVLQEELSRRAKDTHINVVSTPDDAILRVDGTVLGPTGQSYRIDPGEHEIRVEKSGFVTTRQIVTVAANENRSLRVHLVEDESSKPKSRTLPYAGIGLGLTGLAVGGVLVGIDGPVESDSRGEIRDTKTAGFVCMGVGAAVLGVSLYALLREEDKRDSDSPIVTILPGTSGGYLGVSSRF